MASDGGSTCPICYDTLSETVTTPCGHVFCKLCHENWYNENATCPMCRQIDHATTSISSTAQTNSFQQLLRSYSYWHPVYNQALIDNYRIHHAQYSDAVKRRSRQLLRQMSPPRDEDRRRGSSVLPSEAEESHLRDYQEAISHLFRFEHRAGAAAEQIAAMIVD